jgi:hypothetical protein
MMMIVVLMLASVPLILLDTVLLLLQRLSFDYYYHCYSGFDQNLETT